VRLYDYLGDVRTIGVIWGDPLAEGGPLITAALIIERASHDAHEIERRWQYYTRGGVARVVAVSGVSARALARRLVVPHRWAPRPGTVPVEAFGALRDAMYKRRWKINWGERLRRTSPTTKGRADA
jgi:hypothetical protein